MGRPHRSMYEFSPEDYENVLVPLLKELNALEVDQVDDRALARLLKRYPKDGDKMFSKSEIIRAYRAFKEQVGFRSELVRRLASKPIRTQSGVTPVTVLTKPFPCPGRCVFCPSDVRMPKSYLSMEPGAQRAAQHRFDPYAQIWSRLAAFHLNGHSVEKVELIVLGGTWSFYPEAYQIWFIKRCFDAMNDFGQADPLPLRMGKGTDFSLLHESIEGGSSPVTYNEVVSRFLREQLGDLVSRDECARWDELVEAQVRNENAHVRNVGLVLETRPDALDEAEVRRLRRLGATKIQLGLQSLSDEILRKSQRGHEVSASRTAMRLLRCAGFKIHAHWMPNLLGSNPAADLEDFARLFEDRDFRPDELKIYPCSLIDSAELMRFHRAGEWQPYEEDELVDLLTKCLVRVPEYCRVTRVIRDIPSHDIVVGNKLSNLRERAEDEAKKAGLVLRDIRSREIRGQKLRHEALTLRLVTYETSAGLECFLQEVTSENQIVAFLRLSLPSEPTFIEEIASSAIVRELHVYGQSVELRSRSDGAAQHQGLGRRLLEAAAIRAREAGFRDLAVISAIGTRAYYRSAGFVDGELYQHRPLSSA